MELEESQMSELGNAMKKVLANTFVMYMMAHKYHLNVEGRNFLQYHELFGTIYNELWQSIDLIAENIRALDEYAPFNLGRIQELSDIEDDSRIPTAAAMMERLLDANSKVTQSLKAALSEAKVQNNGGLENMLAARLETHDKHAWFLRATGKQNRE